jgi:hypothetical protein
MRQSQSQSQSQSQLQSQLQEQKAKNGHIYENFTQFTNPPQNSQKLYPHRAGCKYNRENFSIESNFQQKKNLSLHEEQLLIQKQIYQKENILFGIATEVRKLEGKNTYGGNNYKLEISELYDERDLLIPEINTLKMKILNIQQRIISDLKQQQSPQQQSPQQQSPQQQSPRQPKWKPPAGYM